MCSMTAFEIFLSLLSTTNFTRIRFAVAADTPHSFRTSAFMVLSWVLRYSQILFQRSATLPIVSSLIQSLA